VISHKKLDPEKDDVVTLKCRCAAWRANLPLVFEWAGSARDYLGKPFEFCPWCAKPLTNRRAYRKALAAYTAAEEA
jgi:hypothetical protein